MAPHCTPPSSTYKPLDAPQLQMKGCQVGRDSHLQSWWCSLEGNFQCQFNCFHCRSRSFRCNFFRLLRRWFGRWWQLGYGSIFWVGGAEDMGECYMDPLRSLCRPSASDPAIASSIFLNPSVSNHCASSLNALALFSRSNPWKKRKKIGSITKIRLKRQQW